MPGFIMYFLDLKIIVRPLRKCFLLTWQIRIAAQWAINVAPIRMEQVNVRTFFKLPDLLLLRCADFPTNHTKREPGPTHAVKMGVSQPISTEKSLTISATGKSSLTLDCTDSEGTPLGHLTFPLVPPFKQGEIRSAA